MKNSDENNENNKKIIIKILAITDLVQTNVVDVPAHVLPVACLIMSSLRSCRAIKTQRCTLACQHALKWMRMIRLS
jgi:hypothetical protein